MQGRLRAVDRAAVGGAARLALGVEEHDEILGRGVHRPYPPAAIGHFRLPSGAAAQSGRGPCPIAPTVTAMRAVVVGSGFGGLAAAIRLAAAGHEVTVLEKRDRIGGRAYQYQLGGFRFDGGPTVLTAPFMFEELFDLAGERMSDHVELVPLDPFYRSFDADGRAFDYHASQSAMLAEVTARSPSDAAGFQRLGRRISGIFDAFYPYTERPMMQPQVMLAMLPYLLQHRAMLDVNQAGEQLRARPVPAAGAVVPSAADRR